MAADTMMEDPEIEYPSLSERVQSTFIDTMFIIIAMFVFASVLGQFENVPDWIRIILFLAIWVVYEPLCTTLGFTLGNYAKGIRVRSFSDPNEKINFLQAIVRYLLKLSLGWVSFFTVHTNYAKRAVHDLVAGSVMIKI
jgi:uncharacterized RDD family membrane protein YckC